MFLGGFILISLTVALMKHRLFQKERIEFLVQTEKDWINSGKAKRTIKRRTEEIQNLSCFERTKAYYWLKGTMIIATFCLFGLGLYNLFLLLKEIIYVLK